MHRVALRGVEKQESVLSSWRGYCRRLDPHLEYEETVNKARAMAKALAMATQIG